MIEKEEYIEGNILSKFMGFGLLALLIILMILFDPIFEWVDARGQMTIYSYFVIALPYVFLSWIIAIFTIRLGLQIKRSGQYPPPDFKPAFKTKIRRGRYAKIMWWMLFINASLMIAAPLLSLYIVYSIIN